MSIDTHLPGWKRFAVRILPVLVFVCFLYFLRQQTSVDAYNISLTVLLIFLCLRTQRQPIRLLAGILPALGLVLSFLARANDRNVETFYRHIWPYGYSFVIFLLVARRFKTLPTRYFVFGFLLLGMATELAVGLTEVEPAWNHAIDSELNPALSNERVKLYPYGSWYDTNDPQKIRYPEIISRNFNFLGSRYFLRDIRALKLGIGRRSEPKFESYPRGIWTTLIMTQSFSKVFLSDSKFESATSEILKSFPQGLDKWQDSNGIAFAEKPLCSRNGYLILNEVSGDRVLYSAVGMKGHSITLPLFSEVGAENLFSDGSRLSVTDDGLITVDLKSNSTNIEIRPPRFWHFAALSFWVPACVWGILFVITGALGFVRSTSRDFAPKLKRNDFHKETTQDLEIGISYK